MIFFYNNTKLFRLKGKFVLSFYTFVRVLIKDIDSFSFIC